MTNSEIRKDIEKRIILQNGVKGTFYYLIEENAKVIIQQIPNLSAENDCFYIANMAISFSIGGFKRAGIINKLYRDILIERNENVVSDEVMNYALIRTKELLK